MEEIFHTLEYVVNKRYDILENSEIKDIRLYIKNELICLIQKPITISPIYIKKYGNIDNTFSEESVKKRIKVLLDKLK